MRANPDHCLLARHGALLLPLLVPLAGFSGEWTVASNKPCSVWNTNPRSGEVAEWSGACDNDKAHGPGVLRWVVNGETTSSAEGIWERGMMNGPAVVRYRNGGRYEGTMRDGMRHGRGRLLSPSNALLYDGEWQDGLRHGRGTAYYADGGRYEGFFEKDKSSGSGVLFLPNGGRHEGTFADGKAEGPGKYIGQDGTLREGIWAAGRLSKLISESRPSSQVAPPTAPKPAEQPPAAARPLPIAAPGQQGWIEAAGAPCKAWRLVPKEQDAFTWTGACPDGIASGEGVLTWLRDGVPTRRFQGSLVDGRADGLGREELLQIGAEYSGSFLQGYMHGNGVMRFKDGSSFAGEHVRSRPHGKGVYTGADGVVKDVVWNQGNLVSAVERPPTTNQAADATSGLPSAASIAQAIDTVRSLVEIFGGARGARSTAPPLPVPPAPVRQAQREPPATGQSRAPSLSGQAPAMPSRPQPSAQGLPSAGFDGTVRTAAPEFNCRPPVCTPRATPREQPPNQQQPAQLAKVVAPEPAAGNKPVQLPGSPAPLQQAPAATANPGVAQGTRNDTRVGATEPARVPDGESVPWQTACIQIDASDTFDKDKADANAFYFVNLTSYHNCRTPHTLAVCVAGPRGDTQRKTFYSHTPANVQGTMLFRVEDGNDYHVKRSVCTGSFPACSVDCV